MVKRQFNQASFPPTEDESEVPVHIITNVTPKLPSLGMSLSGVSFSSPVPPSRKKRMNSTPKCAAISKKSTLLVESQLLQKNEKSIFSFSEEVDNLCPVCEETCTCGSASVITLSTQADVSATLSCETFSLLFYYYYKNYLL